ncbi:hypothetical protein ACJX0J_009801 [Zea mays]
MIFRDEGGHYMCMPTEMVRPMSTAGYGDLMYFLMNLLHVISRGGILENHCPPFSLKQKKTAELQLHIQIHFITHKEIKYEVIEHYSKTWDYYGEHEMNYNKGKLWLANMISMMPCVTRTRVASTEIRWYGFTSEWDLRGYFEIFLDLLAWIHRQK